MTDARRRTHRDPRREGVLRHDADLLRQRRPAHRPRLHDGRRRRAHPLAPPARRGRLVPHRHRRARPEGHAHAPRRNGVDPAGVDRPAGRGRPGSRCWRPRHRQRRLHPHHRAAPHASGCRSSCRRSTTRARSTRASYEGPYCVGCEEFKLPAELRRRRGRVRGPASSARSTAARSRCSRRRTTSSGCREYADQLLELYEAQPGLRAARERAQRGRRRSSSRACRTCRSRARPSTGASRSRGTPTHVLYVWIDALLNYATAVGYGTDPEQFDAALAGRRPPGRQGHPAVPRGDLAGDADGRRACRCRARSSRTAGCWSAARR